MRQRSWLLFAVLAASSFARAGDGSVFVNEFHYDNAGTDEGEAIEVAGPAGTSLNGWSLVLYNGSNGLSYATLPLAGSIPDTCGGFGALSFDAPGFPTATALRWSTALMSFSSSAMKGASLPRMAPRRARPARMSVSANPRIRPSGSRCS